MAALNPLAVKDQNRSDILAGTKQTKTSTTSCTMETTGTEVGHSCAAARRSFLLGRKDWIHTAA